MTLTPSLRLPALRWLLAVDTITCTAAGLLMILAANPLADATDLPVNLLRITGLVLVPYVFFLIVLVTRETIPWNGAAAVVGINAAWVAASIGILISGLATPNGFGVLFVLAQAAGVLLLAVLQYVRLRAVE
jgi:hypothetical protein